MLAASTAAAAVSSSTTGSRLSNSSSSNVMCSWTPGLKLLKEPQQQQHLQQHLPLLDHQRSCQVCCHPHIYLEIQQLKSSSSRVWQTVRPTT
jgi:hypothetical protein